MRHTKREPGGHEVDFLFELHYLAPTYCCFRKRVKRNTEEVHFDCFLS